MSLLDGRLVALSISDAPDRQRLGFPQREIDRAVLSVSTALVRQGAQIAYSGNLDPDGYTFKIFRHLAGAFASERETPFHHFVPEPVGRRIEYEQLRDALQEGRGTVRTQLARADCFVTARVRQVGILLGEHTRVHCDSELAEWFSDTPTMADGAAFSVARRMVSEKADARVLVGGKMGIIGLAEDSYRGVAPGIAEEAMMTLERGRPVVVLGAFGGASRDIAIALGLLDESERVPRPPQNPTYSDAMQRLAALRETIPQGLRDRLSELADDDRAEQTAFSIACLIDDWLKLTSR